MNIENIKADFWVH